MTLCGRVTKRMESVVLKLQKAAVCFESREHQVRNQGTSDNVHLGASIKSYRTGLLALKGSCLRKYGRPHEINCQEVSKRFWSRSKLWHHHAQNLNCDRFALFSSRRKLSSPLSSDNVSPSAKHSSENASESVPDEGVHESPASLTSLVEDLNKLKLWLSSNGAYLGHIDVGADSTGGLGLVATQAVKKGERLIGLPKHLQLTYEEKSRGEDASLLPLIERIPDQLWGVKLGMKLLSERAKVKGEWWPYILNLPQKFSLPMFWGKSASFWRLPLLSANYRFCRVGWSD
jgi:hypothetical protein